MKRSKDSMGKYEIEEELKDKYDISLLMRVSGHL
jgi:hypothetical protein